VNPFRRWWNAASPEQKKRLARRASTTVSSLHQLAGSYRTKGKLHASPELARRIEIASRGALKRTELCPACGRCELAKRCGQ